MKAPAIPANESERLRSLRESGLLESPHHLPYDRLTRLAKRLFNVPLASVNLIDEHVQGHNLSRVLPPQLYRVTSLLAVIPFLLTRRWWFLIPIMIHDLSIIRWSRPVQACVFTPGSRCACRMVLSPERFA